MNIMILKALTTSNIYLKTYTQCFSQTNGLGKTISLSELLYNNCSTNFCCCQPFFSLSRRFYYVKL